MTNVETHKQLKQAISQLHSFVEEQRYRFEVKQNNEFAFRFREVGKYLEYLLIVNQRYRQSSEEYAHAHRELMESIQSHGTGSHRLTLEESRLQVISYEKGIALALDTESAYVSATTLLNFLAKATQYYFGPSDRNLWKSFTSFVNHLIGYLELKNIKPPPSEFIEQARDLSQQVGKFRGDYLSHKDEADHLPRTLMGFGYTRDYESIKFTPTIIYPQPGEEKSIDGSTPEEITESLCSFINTWLDYLKTHQDKAYMYPSS